MPISFGRHKDDAAQRSSAAIPANVHNDHVVSELGLLAKKHVTGMLEVTDRTHGGTARLYAYEGGLYSVRLEGYEHDPFIKFPVAV